MKKKIDLEKSPESHCPRFDFCCINQCPLNCDYKKLINNFSDPAKIQKQKCTSKNVRMRIGKIFNLPFIGMTSREFSRYINPKISNQNHTLTKDFPIQCKDIPKKDFNRSLHGEMNSNSLIQHISETSEEVIING